MMPRDIALHVMMRFPAPAVGALEARREAMLRVSAQVLCWALFDVIQGAIFAVVLMLFEEILLGALLGDEPARVRHGCSRSVSAHPLDLYDLCF